MKCTVTTVTLSHVTDRRYVRVGACPVLEVTVTYPRMETADEAAAPIAVSRFNEAYRAMAESFLAWALDAPAREATEAFCAEGAGAAYRFDRRVLLCRMTASTPADTTASDAHYLTVEREICAGSRRGEAPKKHFAEKDFWRWPTLVLFNPRRKRADGSWDKKEFSMSVDGAN